ncbi:MAG: hypothetical protein JO300_00235 [Silvibacterium sp.]|nr:hypothetical protein [Silvibacterium sp.]
MYSFSGGADGASPDSLIRDERGNLYGTARGGSSGAGVVFRLDREGKETVLYSFTGGADGASPNSLIRDEAGNLYGTTQDGGVCPLPGGCGVVFKLDPSGKETVLYSFCSQTNCADGAFPGVLIRDERGNLYGTAQYGAYGSGVVFRLDPSGTETVLYSFCSQTDCADGDYPTDLIRAEHGSLYGTTAFGGNSNCTFGFPPPPFGCGMVFKLDRSGRETVLYSFTAADGAFPDSLTLGDGDRWNPAGNLYGAAEGGGNLSSPICDQFGGEGCGVVFELDRWGKERVLHIFQGPDGMSPRGLLTYHDSLYGITAYGGPAIGEGNAGAGVIFKIKLDDDNDHDHEIDH